MELSAEKPRYTVDRYLQMEDGAQDRHEYHDGEILAMAGGTYEHAVIIANVLVNLGAALSGKPCRVLDSNLRVGIPSARQFVYPDVQVMCGPPQFDPRDPSRQSVTNPRVVVEVLSPSTEAFDRGRKFHLYRELESFEEYILVSQGTASVETFFRQEGGTWLFTPYSGIDGVMKVRSLAVELKLSDVYAGVEFRPEPESETKAEAHT